jgi:4,5-DOPA dioxygenase extradiol
MTTLKLSALGKLTDDLEDTAGMPALFVGHGNPMNAIEENQFVTGWRNMIVNIEIPKAILCISAHWETQGTFVTAMNNPRTIHDFGGFPQKLFDVQYKAPGNPDLAAFTKKTIQSTDVQLDYNWGLDHGCWSVIKQMYPKADIPVIQLSIDYTKPLRYHLALAKELTALRSKGVLIIGSGNMVHNLRKVDWEKENSGYDWAIEANEGLKKMIKNEEMDKLTSLNTMSSAYQLAVPTPEHYIPLLYTLGLKEKDELITFYNDTMVMGSLSMTSLKIG